MLNLHNHTFDVADGEHDLRGRLARIPEARLGPDINWLIGAGVNPVDLTMRFGTRIGYAHLRDQKAGGTWCEAMGEGATDYAAIAAAFRKSGFHGDERPIAQAQTTSHESTYRRRTIRQPNMTHPGANGVNPLATPMRTCSIRR